MSKTGIAGVLGVLIVLVGIMFVISKPYATAPPPQPTPPPITLTKEAIQQNWKEILANVSSPAYGNPKAPYTMVEIGDFQCPQCGKMEPVVKALVDRSGGKVNLYFINYPIPSIHPHANDAALIGLAAADQGKFWPMYDLMYGNQDELIPTEIEYNARAIPGLDAKRLAKDAASSKDAAILGKQVQFLNHLGVQYTPTFLVNTPDGSHPALYVGSKGQAGTPGLMTAAQAPPWGGPGAMDVFAKQAAPSVPGSE